MNKEINIDIIVEKAFLLHKLERYKEAIEIFNKILELDPKNIDALCNKGVCLFKDADSLPLFESGNDEAIKMYLEAVKMFDEALKIIPKNIKVLYYKGYVFAKLGRYRFEGGVASPCFLKNDEAIKIFDQILELSPNDIEVLYNKGVVCYWQRRLEEALKIFEKILKLSPKNNAGLTGRYFVLAALGKQKEADKVEKEYIANHGNDGFNYNFDFQFLLLSSPSENPLNNYEIINTCDKLLEIESNDRKTLITKWGALENLEKYEEVNKILDNLIELDSEKRDHWLYRKGLILEKLEKYDEALIIFDKALEINPKNNNAANSKAWISFNLKYNSILKIKPDVFLQKWFVYDCLKKYEKEIRGYRHIMNFDRGEIYAIGILLCSLGRYEEAIEMLNTALEQNSQNCDKTLEINHQNNDIFYLFFDTETTGLPQNYKASHQDLANWPRVVQLAWILTNKQGDVIEEKSFIVKPDGFSIPAASTAIHGIDESKANKLGISITDVLNIFNQSLHNNPILVAHNMNFDINVLGAEFIRADFDTNFMNLPRICTMEYGIDFCGLPNRKFPTLFELHKRLFNYDFMEAHDALVDASACYRCFFEMKKRKIINL